MKWVYIEDLDAHIDQEIEIRGWVYNKRSSGKIRFLLVRDGTGLIQGTIYSPGKDHPLFQKFDALTQESSVILRGKIRRENRAPGGWEMSIDDIEILQVAEEYPITPKEHGTSFLMEHRHLWLRSRKQHAILEIRAELIKAIRDFFDGRGFRNLDTPILTPSACEGTTTLFETEYFDQKAYLSQSGQLYNEATAMAFGKVYCFGPTFRAEKSKTRKHSDRILDGGTRNRIRYFAGYKKTGRGVDRLDYRTDFGNQTVSIKDIRTRYPAAGED